MPFSGELREEAQPAYRWDLKSGKTFVTFATFYSTPFQTSVIKFSGYLTRCLGSFPAQFLDDFPKFLLIAFDRQDRDFQ